ncbi:smad nuclear-interacting protein 1-like [Glandiceps talaboti]
MKYKYKDRTRSRSRSPHRKQSHHSNHRDDKYDRRPSDRHGDRHRGEERTRDKDHRSRQDKHSNRHRDTDRDDRERHRDHEGRGRHRDRDRDDRRQDFSHIRIKQERDDNDRRRRDDRRRKPANPFESDEQYQYGQPGSSQEQTEPAAPKEEPNFGLSGKLTEDSNTFRGVVIKYNEPQEARKPKRRWRLYPFKGEESLPVLHIHRQSAYLFGRDRLVADIPIDHPSCSKQHAVLQYRLIEYERDDGRIGRRVRPYIIDLDSSNGTFVNNNKIDPSRYVELIEKDVVKFGFSSREYVMLHDKSKGDDSDTDEEK